MSGPDDLKGRKTPDKAETVPSKEWKTMTPDEIAAAQSRVIAMSGGNKAREAANTTQSAERIAGIQQTLGIKNPDQLRESAIEKALKEGGARLHMSFSSSRSNSGFRNIETRIQDRRQPAQGLQDIVAKLYTTETRSNLNLDREMNDRRVNELIDIRRETKPEYRDVTVPGRKGILGMGGIPDRVEKRETGNRLPVMHSELVANGKDEPAVRITYYAQAGGYAEKPDGMQWRDYSGRDGQMLMYELVVPESAAKDIEREIDANAGYVRALVDRFAKERFMQDPSIEDEAVWDHPHGAGDALRPPYERWDRLTGGRIYVQKESGEPGWQDACVQTVKRK